LKEKWRPECFRKTQRKKIFNTKLQQRKKARGCRGIRKPKKNLPSKPLKTKQIIKEERIAKENKKKDLRRNSLKSKERKVMMRFKISSRRKETQGKLQLKKENLRKIAAIKFNEAQINLEK